MFERVCYEAVFSSWTIKVQYIIYEPMILSINVNIQTKTRNMSYMNINDQHKFLTWDPTKQNKIWDSCTQADKNYPDKIQNEAARITTGATKLDSIDKLYKEICWESLQKGRNDHRFTVIFKMYNHLSPVYLSFLIPQ